MTDLLDASLADWHADPLSVDDSGTWVITGHVEETVGTSEYARRAHTLVQALLATGSVHRAEADLPVTAFVHPGAPITEADVPPGSEESPLGSRRDPLRRGLGDRARPRRRDPDRSPRHRVHPPSQPGQGRPRPRDRPGRHRQ